MQIGLLRDKGICSQVDRFVALWALSGVVLDGRASGPVLSGVPQGSVLGPVLFLVFVSDLPENIRSSVRLFADDCVLYGSIGSHTDCQVLRDGLGGLAQWEANWQMRFNVAKCRSVRVTRHPPDGHIQFEYTLRQQGLERVRSAKYLGITISDDLDWGQHISGISSGAAKTLGFLRRSLAFAPGHTGEVAYKALVRPGLGYAAPVWHPCRETQIGQVGRVRGTAAGWACGRWGAPVASATCLAVLSGRPWGPAGSGLP